MREPEVIDWSYNVSLENGRATFSRYLKRGNRSQSSSFKADSCLPYSTTPSKLDYL